MSMNLSRHLKKAFARRKTAAYPRFVATPPLVYPEKKLALFWNAKAGCTLGTKWFFFQQGLLEEAEDYDPWIHLYRARVYQQRPEYLAEIDRLPSSRYLIAKLVRSPFRRAVSSYLHAVTNRHIDKRLAACLGREIDPEQTLSYEEFVEFLSRTGVDTCDDHHRRQVTPKELSGEISLDKIIPLEDCAKGFRELETALGLPAADLPSLSRSGHHRDYLDHGTYCGGIAYPMKTKVFGAYKDFYNDDTQEKIAEVYAEDFAAYGYDPEIL